MQLSKNFCLSEFTRSDTAKRLGINNDNVDMEVVLNLAFLCHMVLQRLSSKKVWKINSKLYLCIYGINDVRTISPNSTSE